MQSTIAACYHSLGCHTQQLIALQQPLGSSYRALCRTGNLALLHTLQRQITIQHRSEKPHWQNINNRNVAKHGIRMQVDTTRQNRMYNTIACFLRSCREHIQHALLQLVIFAARH
jgi:hypothetical protein